MLPFIEINQKYKIGKNITKKMRKNTKEYLSYNDFKISKKLLI